MSSFFRALVERKPAQWAWEKVKKRGVQGFLTDLAKFHARGPAVAIEPIVKNFLFQRDGLGEVFQSPHRMAAVGRAGQPVRADCDDWAIAGATWAMQQGLPARVRVMWHPSGAGHAVPEVLGEIWDLSGYRQTGDPRRGRQFQRITERIIRAL